MGATANNYSGNRIRCLPRQRQSQAQASQGKAGMRGVACGTPPGPGMLRFVRPVPGSRYTMRRSSSWTMTCRLINLYNCMHSFQCGFEVVFTVNVHCLFYVFFISFIYSCFTHCAYLIRLRICYAYRPIFVSTSHWTLFDIFYLNNETAAVMSIWMFLIALSVLLIYNFLSTPINEMFLLSRVLCVFSIFIFISINKHVCNNMRNRVLDWSCIFLVCLHELCVNQHTCAKLLICVVYLEISPAESPPQITGFFLRTVKKNLITAILENSSFLAKTLTQTIHAWVTS